MTKAITPERITKRPKTPDPALNGVELGDLCALEAGLAFRKVRENAPKFWTCNLDEVQLQHYYAGRDAFLICSGPSLTTHDLSKLRRPGIVTMGVNNSWSVFRPTLWTCVDSPGRFLDTGWKDPSITKFAPLGHFNAKLRHQTASGEMKESSFRVRQMPSTLFYARGTGFDPETFLDTTVFSWGMPGNKADSIGVSGFRSVMLVAMKLLIHLGVRNVYLVGADFKMVSEKGYAFDEIRKEGSVRHNNALYDALNRRFTSLGPSLAARGVSVFNCNRESGLTAFPHLPFDEAVKRASAEASKPINTRGWYSS